MILKVSVDYCDYSDGLILRVCGDTRLGDEFTEKSLLSWNIRPNELIESSIDAFWTNRFFLFFDSFSKLCIASDSSLLQFVSEKISFAKEDCLHLKEQLKSFLLVCLTNAHFSGNTCGLFMTASRMNHSCSPNTIFFITSDSTTTVTSINFKCISSLADGDELTCSYLKDYQLLFPFTWRQRILLSEKYFSCYCNRCRLESELTPQSPSTPQFPLALEHVLTLEERCLFPSELSLLRPNTAGAVYPVLKYLILSHHFGKLLEITPDFVLRAGRFYEKYILSCFLLYSWIFRCSNDDNSIPKAFIAKWLLFGIRPLSIGPISDWISLCTSNGIDLVKEELDDSIIASIDSFLFDDVKGSRFIVSVDLCERLMKSLLTMGGFDCIKILSKCMNLSELKEDLYYLKHLFKSSTLNNL